MNEDPPAPRADVTLGSSSIYRLCEEVIALRETNSRQHKMFEQALARARDDTQAAFNAFAADTQRAYQQLRHEVHGDKRLSVALLNELLDVATELQQIAAARPRPDDAEAAARWADAVAVEARKVEEALRKHGVHPYDAVP